MGTMGRLCEKWMKFERNFNTVKFAVTRKPIYLYHLLIIIPQKIRFVKHFLKKIDVFFNGGHKFVIFNLENSLEMIKYGYSR